MYWPEIFEETAQHYAQLAKVPGWFQHCKQQIITMGAEPSSPWIGLRARWGEILTQDGFRPSKQERDGWWL